MSGRVDPTGGAGLPEEEQKQPSSGDRHHDPPSAPRRRSLLSFFNLLSVTIMVVFPAIGLIAVMDLAFVAFAFIYVYFFSKVAFPSLGPSAGERVFDRNNRVLRLYMLASAVIGLFLPIAYILAGIFDGDSEGIQAAAAHLFLLAAQVLGEGVVAWGRFSIPVFVFVPVFFNSRRIFTILEWVRAEMGKAGEEDGGAIWKVFAGRALAAANMAFWSFNLFGFLLPVYLPRAFKKYYLGYCNNNDDDKRGS